MLELQTFLIERRHLILYFVWTTLFLGCIWVFINSHKCSNPRPPSCELSLVSTDLVCWSCHKSLRLKDCSEQAGHVQLSIHQAQAPLWSVITARPYQWHAEISLMILTSLSKSFWAHVWLYAQPETSLVTGETEQTNLNLTSTLG